ncbi:hypothetical protein [Chryseobacterium sp. JUb7]|uniref:hypothetical protein n=1 Tax=Chryseobacterium sp. JUb7 TaxID=2940599 RepID=UPI002168597E|nr:hypothetical protein [Chryseobacterium sp. JUb7]MCS3532012.1 hypothetical protein [Chryseobacterium sp. JUb7]
MTPIFTNRSLWKVRTSKNFERPVNPLRDNHDGQSGKIDSIESDCIPDCHSKYSTSSNTGYD